MEPESNTQGAAWRHPHIMNAIGAVVFLRVIASLAWLDSAFVGKDAKFSPSFLSGAGLNDVVTHKFLHTAMTSGTASFLQNTVLPHVALFAWLIALGHLAAGLSLCAGLFTRLGGALTIFLAATNIMVAGGAGADTVGFNSMLIAAGIICIVSGAGRSYGVDGALLSRLPDSALLRTLA